MRASESVSAERVYTPRPVFEWREIVEIQAEIAPEPPTIFRVPTDAALGQVVKVLYGMLQCEKSGLQGAHSRQSPHPWWIRNEINK
jgi:hypothetical protein